YANSRNQQPDRVTFEVGDAQDLHFADGAFGGSLSLLVVNFIPDAAKAVREMRRITQPGGRISAAVWDYGEGMTMLRAFWDAAVSIDPGAEKRDEKHMRFCRSGELAQLWTSNGLESVLEKPLSIAMKVHDFADYWDPFLLGQGPAGAYVRTLKVDQVQALRDAVRRRLSVTDESASFSIPSQVWAVRGTVPAVR
ncbi:MAG: class I SAM-dependent methyltransferase, partial [Bryobacteraceae bacterium]